MKLEEFEDVEVFKAKGCKGGSRVSFDRNGYVRFSKEFLHKNSLTYRPMLVSIGYSKTANVVLFWFKAELENEEIQDDFFLFLERYKGFHVPAAFFRKHDLALGALAGQYEPYLMGDGGWYIDLSKRL
jgi:hypothetical protein